jgi:6-pyruvoyltetrahydropterin/6-carboxytetrahydropterin synthase
LTYRSTKTYGHELGLSATFRQWRAESHCNTLHGYALSFKFTFEADELDDRNWVMDFGGLSELKEKLKKVFDHKTIVAKDDPKLGAFQALEGMGVADLVILEGVGCELFAKKAYELGQETLEKLELSSRIRIVSVECAEHGANSAVYIA